MIFIVYLDERQAKMYAVYLDPPLSIGVMMFNVSLSLAAFGRRRSADSGQLGLPV
jgi:hypothetical protein